MTKAIPHVTVCVCTLKRPALLDRLLKAVLQQRTENAFTLSVVVTDNDQGQSARQTVESFSKNAPFPVVYECEPEKNISLARNRCIARAQGEFIAFIDDDEFPAEDWIRRMLQTCEQGSFAGVLGPVRPHFDEAPPDWIVRGKFCDRPEHPTGRVMDWQESRTGNLLFRTSILQGKPQPFDPAFGTGGEDKDFFMRMTAEGHVFVWCNEAPVYETVPPSRWTRSYMLKRALLRGKNILKHPEGKFQAIGSSLIAVPIYSLIVPFTLFFGQHRFMKWCIRYCDHLGRLLACVGANPISERDL